MSSWVRQALTVRDGEQTVFSRTRRGISCRRNSFSEHQTGQPGRSGARQAGCSGRECRAVPGPRGRERAELCILPPTPSLSIAWLLGALGVGVVEQRVTVAWVSWARQWVTR